MQRKLLYREEEGVSPVIATILMVAITVVLAAVLYVMVIGFGTTQQAKPVVLFSGKTKASTGTWTFSPQPDKQESMSSYQVLVRNGTVAAITPALLNTCVASPFCTGSGLTIKVTDDVSAGQLTSADIFTLSGLDDTQVSGTYTVVLVYSGSEVGTIKIP